MALKNPFPPEVKLSSDGRTYEVNPDYLAFAGLSPKGKEQFLVRRSLGLVPKPPAMVFDGKPISQHWRDQKSFAHELMRACRFLTRGGLLLAEFWADRAFGDHPDVGEGDRRAYSELLAKYARYPTAAPVDEEGKSVPPAIVVVYSQDWRTPEVVQAPAIEAEVREIAAGGNGQDSLASPALSAARGASKPSAP